MALLFSPYFRAADQSNAPIAGAFLSFYATQTSTLQPIYADANLTIALTNPIQSDGNGVFPAIWLDDSLPAYKIVMQYPDQNNPTVPGEIVAGPNGTIDPYNYAFNYAAIAKNIAQQFWGRTQAEITLNITPADYFHPPGVINRYASNSSPGVTNMNAAFAAALAQQQAGGDPIQLLAETYLVTTNAIKTQNNQKPVVVVGVPFQSCIVNKAPANTPTIQLIDQFTFEISGIVFAGRTGFPNTAIDLNSASGGQRCGFGKIRDCVLMPNGIGIHLAGLNDLVIDSCKYWPNGAGGFPGTATNDGVNALPGGIVSDTNGIGGWNPGEVNDVLIRNFQAGQCNGISATPTGAGILVDGSLNGSSTALNSNHASTSWVIEGYDSGTCERALYTRFCQFFSLRNFYTSLITMDNACTGMLVEAMFGGQIVVDSTKTLGGCDRLTYINCVGTILADSGNSLATHINCDWFGGDGDQSGGKRILGGRVAAGARTADQIGASGLCVGPLGAIQLAGSSGAGLTVSSLGAAVIRLNPNGNCTATIFSKPPADGYVSKVINLSAFTVTFDVAGTSNVADGASCVIPAKREMDFTFDATSQLWYHN